MRNLKFADLGLELAIFDHDLLEARETRGYAGDHPLFM